MPAHNLPILTSWPLLAVSTARLEAGSFFLLALLVSTLALRWLWNRTAADFPKLPRLNFGRAAALVLLWGSLFLVVLTMIAATREMMQPGVWAQKGLLYRIPDATALAPAADANAENLPAAVGCLLFGWFSFLRRNLPLVTVNWAGLATGLAILAITLAAMHVFFRSWRPWRFRWTVMIVLALAVLFAAGFSTIGLARHVGWLCS